jgi:hypothetical protein
MLLFVEIKLEILRPGKLGSVKNVWHCHKGSPVPEHVAGRDRRHFSQYYYSRKLRLPTIHVYFHAMHSQPIPSVTWTDVEVLVRRDYSGDHFSEVFSILKEYEKHSSDEDPSRVQVAVLKLAHGNVERLRLHVKAATFDRRDVVLAAQYPEYLKNGFPVEALPSQRKGRDKRTTEKGTCIR